MEKSDIIMNNGRENDTGNYLMATDRDPLLLLPYISFFLPLYAEIFSSGQGISIQWAMFRYQVGPGSDTQLIPFSVEVLQLLTAFSSGHDVAEVILWLIATGCMVGAFVMTLYGLWAMDRRFLTRAPVVLILSGFFFLVSVLIRYAFLRDSCGNFFIPAGILCMFFFGWWGYRYVSRAPRSMQPEISAIPAQPVRFFSVTLAGIEKKTLKKDLIILAFTGLVVKLLVISAALPMIGSIISGDMTLYYWYADSIFHGRYPYISFNAEYPQFFFIPLIAAYFPLMTGPEFTGFLCTFGTMNLLFDLGTLVCVYILAARFFDQARAFRAGLLYATAISTAFFIPILFDIIPTFFLVFSLCCFIHGRELVSYLSAAAGVLLKWFPFACFPVFFISNLKNRREMNVFRNGATLSILLAAACMLPFFLLNQGKFIDTYRFHIVRLPEAHSLVYYCDAVFSSFFHVQVPGNVFLILMVLAECFLLYGYFRYLDGSELTLTGVLFLSVLVFFLCNKVMATYYLVWMTPFLAILLGGSLRHLIVFYAIQIIMYLETPT
jgi:hypothetical protein